MGGGPEGNGVRDELAACGELRALSALGSSSGRNGGWSLLLENFPIHHRPPPLVALEKVTGESDQFGREKGSPAHAQSRISCGVERDLGDPREWLVKSDRSSALECQGSQTHPLTLVTAPLSLVISPILNQTLGKHETALWGRMAGWFRSTRGEQGTSAHRL